MDEVEAHIVKANLTMMKISLSEDFGVYVEISEPIFDALSEGRKKQVGLLVEQICEAFRDSTEISEVKLC